MVHLVKDPKGETVFEPSSSTDRKLNIVPTKGEVTGQVDEIIGLKQRISELEKKLKEVCMIINITVELSIIRITTHCIYPLKVAKESEKEL